MRWGLSLQRKSAVPIQMGGLSICLRGFPACPLFCEYRKKLIADWILDTKASSSTGESGSSSHQLSEGGAKLLRVQGSTPVLVKLLPDPQSMKLVL